MIFRCVGRLMVEHYNYRWQKARKAYLQNNPLCVFCKEENRIEAATVVDHIIPHKGDYKLFWDETNWQSLCCTHHVGTKQAMENGKQVRQVGLDGWGV